MRDNIRVQTHEDLKLYLTQNRHMTCLHAAAQLGCLDCVKWMIEHIGLAPNEQDTRYGATPLHYAAAAGHCKLVKFLLARILRVKTDYDGATPLHDAAVHGHIACVQELLKSCLVDPEMTDNYGLTAAEWAEQAQEQKCVKLLHDAVNKNTSTSRRKKGTSKKDKQTSSLAAFSQYSDSTESQYSSSPLSSETYAQLEPVECSCVTPPELPPRPSVPETPRPKHLTSQPPKTNSCNPINGSACPQEEWYSDEQPYEPINNVLQEPPETNSKKSTNSFSPSSSDQSIKRGASDENYFPPPPSFLTSPSSPPPPPPPLTFQYEATNQTHNYRNKPTSSVPPFSQQLSAFPAPSDHILIGGTQALSPITTPPAPVQSFSTFSSFETSPAMKVEMVHANYTKTQNVGVKDLSSHRQTTVQPLQSHQVNGDNSGTKTPLWKKHLLEQKQKKQREEEKKVAELSEVPDWKQLIYDRKHSKSPVRDKNLDDETNLSPWQKEIKKSGRAIPIYTE